MRGRRSACRPSRRAIGQGIEAQPIYGRNGKATRPLTGSLLLKREGARTQDKTKKGPPLPLAAIFRGGRPLYEPTPKNGDRRRWRERQAGRRPSGPACPDAGKEEGECAAAE
jgi:hypothetical protein